LEKVKNKKKPRVISVHPPQDFQRAIHKAAQCLLSGRLVAYPTESFYGLAVDAKNEDAIKRLFVAKKRRTNRPVLILIQSIHSLEKYVTHIPRVARRLIKAFWPGGLTLLFEAGPKISPLLTAGTGKIGIRLSSHPVATALAREIQGAITGTSANISGEPSCRTADEILSTFGKGVDLILDGGPTAGEIGSTVLDVTADPPRILRQGMIQREQLETFISA
jgi:L-threonylcarbamoyladenylate synthase